MDTLTEKIVVEKKQLLETIKKNFGKYTELRNASIESYWKVMESRLAKALERAKAHRKVDTNFPEIPYDHSDDYKLVIKMLEFSIDDKITLTPQEFSKYVMNNWNWRSEFISQTKTLIGFSGYSGYSGATGSCGSSGISGISAYSRDSETDDLLTKLDEF